jgi:hypothetical protein
MLKFRPNPINYVNGLTHKKAAAPLNEIREKGAIGNTALRKKENNEDETDENLS